MPRTIRFTVHDLPPKKCSERSMWSKPQEIPRVISLRQAAFASMNGAPPLRDAIRLSVRILLATDDRTLGDLDNFVSGICDALQRANTSAGLVVGSAWDADKLRDIAPDRFAVIGDDNAIVSIQAERLVTTGSEAFYEVELRGE